MNFIVKLSKSKKLETEVKYDSILVIVNRLTKRVYFVSFREETEIQNIAYIFNRHIITNHETLAEIIINQDTRFVSTF